MFDVSADDRNLADAAQALFTVTWHIDVLSPQSVQQSRILGDSERQPCVVKLYLKRLFTGRIQLGLIVAEMLDAQGALGQSSGLDRQLQCIEHTARTAGVNLYRPARQLSG